MNKRSITLLAGLMAVGTVSFAMDDNSEDLSKGEKPLSIFDINDRVRFDDNRLEINGNLHLNKENRLEVTDQNDKASSTWSGRSDEYNDTGF